MVVSLLLAPDRTLRGSRSMCTALPITARAYHACITPILNSVRNPSSVPHSRGFAALIIGPSRTTGNPSCQASRNTCASHPALKRSVAVKTSNRHIIMAGIDADTTTPRIAAYANAPHVLEELEGLLSKVGTTLTHTNKSTLPVTRMYTAADTNHSSCVDI